MHFMLSKVYFLHLIFPEVILYSYDWCFISSWNQVAVLHWKWILTFTILMFVTVLTTNTETLLY
jgi:hypothetical protein